MMPALPVTVLSGFLGAGKTTIINHLLRHPGGRRLAVLVNDLAEINLDAVQLKVGRSRINQRHLGDRSFQEGFVELHNGCICCTLRDEFITEVSRLARLDRFDGLLVEATGVAEPLPIAMAFDQGDPHGELLSAVAQVDSMVTVVDTYNFMRDWDSADELAHLGLAVDKMDNRTLADLLAEQVEFANQIVLNKTDLVDPQELNRLKRIVACLNPEAHITSTMFGMVDPDSFLNTRLFEAGEITTRELPPPMPEAPEGLPRERRSGISGPGEASGASSEDPRCSQEDPQYSQIDNKQESTASSTSQTSTDSDLSDTSTQAIHDALGMTSFVYRARRPFHPQRLWNCLNEDWPGVLRSKGLFWLATRMNESGLWSQAGKACSHQSAGRWWSSVSEDLWPDDDELRASILAEFRGPFGDRRQEIVIIGQNLDRAAIRARLDACLVDSLEMQLGPMGWTQLPDPFPPWEAETLDETEIPVPLLRRETPTA